ncbi:MAG: hypothetical protein MJH10_13290 [Epibacterium sp.]|nr:hypothetical protein [Epibacterium sp.]NQX74515.1 hypothetical protein [Epibacterium sp.]
MNLSLDIQAARYCLDAYEAPGHFEALTIGDMIHCAGETYGGDAFVFETLGSNWVVFRGLDAGKAEYWGDLKQALDAYRNRVADLRLHRGFWQQWSELSPMLWETLGSMRMQQEFEQGYAKPTVFAGHSAGGAVATIAAAAMAPDVLVTFGAPRVGGKALGEDLDIESIRRWVNASDAVPHYPAAFGYRHVGDEYLIDANRNLRVNPSVGRRVWELLRGVLSTRDDHRMEQYELALQSLEEKFNETD